MVHVYTGGVCDIDDRIKDAIRKGGYVEIKRLYDEGYRKEEEARKELLKELTDKAVQCGGVLPLRVLRNMLKEVDE